MPSKKSFDPLPVSFYDRDSVEVARALLGKILVRQSEEGLLSGRIVEVEAYLAAGDPACHAARGKTKKNASMFGPPGRAYVYSIHARWCFNVVTEPEHTSSAVLIRAVEPLSGISMMEARRGTEILHDLARGPARLCEAFAIDRKLDGWDLTVGQQLWVTGPVETNLADEVIGISPRIGVTSGHDLPLRFFYKRNRFVSGSRRLNQAAET